MSSKEPMDDIKRSIMAVYLQGAAMSEIEGCTLKDFKTTDDIIDDLAPMATFTKDEINTYMDDASFVVVRHHGQLMWQIYRQPPEYLD